MERNGLGLNREYVNAGLGGLGAMNAYWGDRRVNGRMARSGLRNGN